MLSLVTEDFLAFWIASKRVGLPAGSPPPIRAATSMFLMSLVFILLRLASTIAFLCFVVAHLEWPDISVPSLRARRPDRRRSGGCGCRCPPPGGRTSPATVLDGPRRSYLRLRRSRRGQA